jgi:hypothetical protein
MDIYLFKCSLFLVNEYGISFHSFITKHIISNRKEMVGILVTNKRNGAQQQPKVINL